MMQGVDVHDIGRRPVIVGSGIAGLMTALHLAPEPVVLISRAPLGFDGSSALAQGGIAASFGPDDHPSLHATDTVAAGDGLCAGDVADFVAQGARDAIAALTAFGVQFDADPDGRLQLGLEAAHGRRRILHVAGDRSGRALMQVLTEAVRRTPSITVLERMEARRIELADGAVAGLTVTDLCRGRFLPTGRVVLATGGIGDLFEDTTNPAGAIGQGLAIAARAGAVLADLEFIQFHPTALAVSSRPLPLISEAVRGEGALLVDEIGRRIFADTPGGELAPRDIVARAVANHLARGHRVFLDARPALGKRFAQRFPAIDELCKRAGIDPAHDLIPVRPAAHYHMGGIAVDLAGRSSVSGLWACGEAACTGLHGANRLASNSLLEAAVFARAVAQSVSKAERGVSSAIRLAAAVPHPDASAVRPIMSRALGLVRNARELEDSIAILRLMAIGRGPEADPAIVALMIAVAAWQRTESRGAHFRVDFPHHAALAQRSSLTLAQTVEAAGRIAADAAPPLLSRTA